MTDRDYFAAAALIRGMGVLGCEQIAKSCYEMADAMLRERDKQSVGVAEMDSVSDRKSVATPRACARSCSQPFDSAPTTHDAVPEAKAFPSESSVPRGNGGGCGGTDKPVTLPAVGTGDIPVSRTRDICERLRRWCHAVDAESAQDLMDEAATEIEVQRACTSAARDEIARLRLTDEDREALYRAEARLRTAYVPDDETAATLRSLLARLA